MKKAVALHYDREKDTAPRVVAKGKGVSADKIIQIAHEHHLPIQEDHDLVELLSKVELDQEIPEKLYVAVAEVFTFLYSITSKAKKIN